MGLHQSSQLSLVLTLQLVDLVEVLLHNNDVWLDNVLDDGDVSVLIVVTLILVLALVVLVIVAVAITIVLVLILALALILGNLPGSLRVLCGCCRRR